MRSSGRRPPEASAVCGCDRRRIVVDDIDASIIRVTELRGEVYEKMAVPGAGWFALCGDPHGNQFGLWKRDPAAQPPNLDPALAQFHPGADQE
jgi:hypothetical protein